MKHGIYWYSVLLVFHGRFSSYNSRKTPVKARYGVTLAGADLTEGKSLLCCLHYLAILGWAARRNPFWQTTTTRPGHYHRTDLRGQIINCHDIGLVLLALHDDVIKWKHFRVTGHLCGRSPVNSLHKGQWRGALMFSLICDWITCLVNNDEAGIWNAIAPIMT